MRYIATIFWAFLLSQMLTYVVSSMNGMAYSFNMGLILTVIFSVLIFVLAAIIPKEPENGESSH